MRRLLALLLVCACARRISGGPTPSVTGARNERDLSTAPASLCNAQGDPANGWLMDVLGDDFAPMPADLLSGTPTLLMPVVRLDGPESFVVPDAQVVELAGTIAGYNMVSRFVVATGVEMEEKSPPEKGASR